MGSQRIPQKCLERCPIARIYEGTNEINRMLSVGMLIKKAMKGHVDLLGPATKVGEELIGIPSLKP
jgi:hypothetical protein